MDCEYGNTPFDFANMKLHRVQRQRGGGGLSSKKEELELLEAMIRDPRKIQRQHRRERAEVCSPKEVESNRCVREKKYSQKHVS